MARFVRLSWSRSTASLLVLAVLAAGSACGTSKSTPPSLGNFGLYPSSVNQGDGGGTVSVELSVDVADAGADIKRAELTVLDASGSVLQRLVGTITNPPGVTSGTHTGQFDMPTTSVGVSTVRLQVFDGADDGSNVVEATFTVVAVPPAPVLASLSPTFAVAGTSSLLLTVSGSGFVERSIVTWNGGLFTTTFVDQSTLQVTVYSGLLALPDTVQVAVVTPAPGGGTSSALPFPIYSSYPNPAPAIDSLQPSSLVAGSNPFTLTIAGSGFVPGTTALVGGSERSVAYVSPTALQVLLPAADLAAAGTASIVLVNPAPGGGASAPAGLAVTP